MLTLPRFALALTVGVLIFVGLPLLGWGIGDLEGFVDHPARLAYIMLVILLQGFITVRFPGVGRSGGEGQKLVRRQKLAVIMLQVISLLMVIAVPYADRREFAVMGNVDLMRYAGLVLFAAGFLLMNWSEASLGNQFSIQVTIQDDHQLVTDGPYRFLRHPRYLGIIVFNLGLALLFRSWLGLMLVGLLTLILLWRIHDEEMLMQQEFGAQWDSYARNSWHLIPFVY